MPFHADAPTAGPSRITTTSTSVQDSYPRTRSSPTALRPSRQPEQRVVYFGIKRGEVPGVYTDAREAEEQVKHHPDPCVRCFSTRYAALAYVGGWDCRGLYYIPKGAPYPLFEFLLIHRSVPPALLCPKSSSRVRYHDRLAIPHRSAASKMSEFGALPTGALHPGLAASSDTLTHRASSSTLRPPLGNHRNSWRNSMVKSPSPLRNLIDESGKVSVELDVQRVEGKLGQASGLGLANVFTGPSDPAAVRENVGPKSSTTAGVPAKSKRASIFGISAPSFSRKPTAPAAVLAPTPDTLEPPPPLAPPSLRQSRSDPSLPHRVSAHGAVPAPSQLSSRPRQTSRPSGLWSSSPLASPPHLDPSSRGPRPAPRPAPTMPPAPAAASKQPTFSDTTAPSFSRSTLRRQSGIIMPAAAPRRQPPTPNLSPSSSSSSISSMSSTSSTPSTPGTSPMLRHGGGDFAPPRAGFMRRPPSSLSMSSSSSAESVATITASPSGKTEGYAPEVLGTLQGGFVRPTHAGRAASESVAVAEGKKDKEKKGMKGIRGIFGMKKRA